MTEDLEIYVVYDRPADFPDEYVVRRWITKEGKSVPDQFVCARSKSLDIIHGLMQRDGLVFLTRDPSDDKCIVGTYL